MENGIIFVKKSNENARRKSLKCWKSFECHTAQCIAHAVHIPSAAAHSHRRFDKFIAIDWTNRCNGVAHQYTRPRRKRMWNLKALDRKRCTAAIVWLHFVLWHLCEPQRIPITKFMAWHEHMHTNCSIETMSVLCRPAESSIVYIAIANQRNCFFFPFQK